VIFLVLPVILLLIVSRFWVTRRLLFVLAAVAVLAVVYTGPWDSAIIANGVWSYGPGKVAGVLIARVPLEEYMFYLLQVLLTGALTALLVRWKRN
jgi:lycopene cyclase domain-containing protein